MTDVADRLRAAGMAVKPLEWQDDYSQIPENAVSGLGMVRYTIVLHFIGMNEMVFRLKGLSDFSTLEAAKAAAQRDYESRILAAIIVEAGNEAT
jgi:hypothetical protein